MDSVIWSRIRWVASSALLATVISFATVFISAKALGGERYALYGAIWSIMSTVAQVTAFGLPAIALRDASASSATSGHCTDRVDGYLARMFFVNSLMAVAASIGTFLYVYIVLAPRYPNHLGVPAAIGGTLTVFGNSIANALAPYSLLKDRGRNSGFSSVIRATGLLINVLLLAPLNELSLVLLGAGSVTFLSIAPLLFSVARPFANNFRIKGMCPEVRSALVRAIPAWLGESAVLVSLSFVIAECLVLNKRSDTLAGFLLGNQARLVHGVVSVAIANSFSPNLVMALDAGSISDVRRQHRSHAMLQVTVASAAIGAVVLGGRLVLSHLNLETEGALAAFQLTTLSVLPAGMSMAQGAILNAANRQALTGGLNLLWGCLLVILFELLSQTNFMALALPFSLLGAYSVHCCVQGLAETRMMKTLGSN